MERKLALNLTPYKELRKDEALTSLTDDLASLGLETSGEINYYWLIRTRDKKVVNPERPSTDISEQWSDDTEVEKKETKAAKKRKEYLSNHKGNYVVIWIGPPDPYPGGSVDIGISREIGGLRALESYGFGIDFTDEQYTTIGKNISSLSSKGFEIDKPSDLRDKAFLIELAKNDNPYDLLEEIIPLPRIWEKIRGGAAREKKEEFRKFAQKMAKESIGKIRSAGNRREILEIGANLERQMQRRWERVDFEKSGCGRTNQEALSEYGYTYSHYHIDSSGKITKTHSETGQFVKKCPYCGAIIKRAIEPGYKCSCGNVYKGVC